MRLGVLSNQNLNPWVNWTTLGPPLLKPLAAYDDARIIAPPRVTLSNLREWRTVLRGVRSSDTLFLDAGSVAAGSAGSHGFSAAGLRTAVSLCGRRLEVSSCQNRYACAPPAPRSMFRRFSRRLPRIENAFSLRPV